MGNAYVFFYCNSTIRECLKELPLKKTKESYFFVN